MEKYEHHYENNRDITHYNNYWCTLFYIKHKIQEQYLYFYNLLMIYSRRVRIIL